MPVQQYTLSTEIAHCAVLLLCNNCLVVCLEINSTRHYYSAIRVSYNWSHENFSSYYVQNICYPNKKFCVDDGILCLISTWRRQRQYETRSNSVLCNFVFSQCVKNGYFYNFQFACPAEFDSLIHSLKTYFPSKAFYECVKVRMILCENGVLHNLQILSKLSSKNFSISHDVPSWT